MSSNAVWPTLPNAHPREATVNSIKRGIVHHIHYQLAKDKYTATPRDGFCGLAYAVKDLLIQRWIETQQHYYKRKGVKRVYYISMEYLLGRTLGHALINLGIHDLAIKALQELGLSPDKIFDLEWDAGLGNGGLGRLAACYLDSMATLDMPCQGYGLRYDYGIFFQKIENGYQVESPDHWLRYGNPWEIVRPEFLYPVHFGGRVVQYLDEHRNLHCKWIETDEVMAMAHDIPVPGYGTETVNTLRLWSARSSRGFDLNYFQHGDYIRSVEEKIRSENLTRVLYPADNLYQGKELRLRQEYLLVSATLQDIVRRYKKTTDTFNGFASKVAIQLNDTHPSLAIPELMHILIDKEGLSWDLAWQITVQTFAYTNHTVMPEALEKWPVSLFERLLPRHLQIIYEINYRWLKEISNCYPGDNNMIQKLSLIEEGPERRIKMAYLSIVGSHYINGVSELHSELLKTEIFPEFYRHQPKKFTNKTNGITPRRWLKQCNPGLAKLLDQTIGEDWVCHLDNLTRIIPYAKNKDFLKSWLQIKQENKQRLAKYIENQHKITINLDSIFDIHVKRMHEYKRQLLNILHVISLYHEIKDNPNADFVPRTMIFSGKAAPTYFIAKLIIKLINAVGEVVNHDYAIGNKLKVIFLENYQVSLAELIVPAADVSEQISTAGTEASGTGNMKFALNGALIVGTLDGANIEIKERVGNDNIFIFGNTAEEINQLKNDGYNPWDYYNNVPELKRVIDDIKNGIFSPEQPDLFHPIIDSLLEQRDRYCVLADFALYADCQKKIAEAFKDKTAWTKKSIMNVANMGYFSSDRAIKEYASEIWNI